MTVRICVVGREEAPPERLKRCRIGSKEGRGRRAAIAGANTGIRPSGNSSFRIRIDSRIGRLLEGIILAYRASELFSSSSSSLSVRSMISWFVANDPAGPNLSEGCEEVAYLR